MTDSAADRFFLKPGYQSRPAVHYFEDTTEEEEGKVWQPEVYPLVGHVARLLHCTHIIDIGCGRGGKLAALHPEFKTIGLDYGPNISYCQTHHRFGQWLEWDLEKDAPLPIDPTVLGQAVVVCADVIEHLLNPLPLARQLKRLMEYAPEAVISTPERDLTRGPDDLGPPANPCHVREWTLPEFECWLLSLGFRLDFIGLTSSNDRDGGKQTMVAIVGNNQIVLPRLLRSCADGYGAVQVNGSKVRLRFSEREPYRDFPATSARPQRSFTGLPQPSGPAVSGLPIRVCLAGCGLDSDPLGEVLAQAGHAVVLLDLAREQPPENPPVPLNPASGTILKTGLPALPFRLECSSSQRRSYQAYLWLKEQRFDFVHFYLHGGGGYYSLLAKHQGLAFQNTLLCIQADAPLLWQKAGYRETLTHLDELVIDYLERQSLSLADVAISPSRYLFEWLQAQDWRLPARCHVQPCLYGYARVPSDSQSDCQVRSIQEIVVLGPLERRVELQFFGDELDRLRREKLPSFKVTVLVGRTGDLASADEAFLRQRAKAWPWTFDIVNAGSSDKAFEYLQGPGCLALVPALNENSPAAIYECLAARVPLLTRRIGGIPELIAPEDIERVTAAPYDGVLAQKLIQALRDGSSPVRPAFDLHANQAAWLGWHQAGNGIAEIPAAPPVATSTPGFKISVCLVHHNQPRWLRQALTSIEAQDYPDFEVVLVDDGSHKTEALKLLEELAPVFTQRGWQLLRQEHYTLGPSRNNAARHARGDFLLFMDADNYAKPQELSTLIRLARRTQADILAPFMDWIDQEAEPHAGTRPILRWPFLGDAVAVGLFHNCFGDGNALIRRDVFLAVGGFSNEYQVSPDWEFLAKAVMMGFRLETVPEALFFYRRVKSSQWPPSQQQLDLIRYVRPYGPFLPPGLREAVIFAQGALGQATATAEKTGEQRSESASEPRDLEKTCGHVGRPPAWLDLLIRRLGSRKTRRFLRQKLATLHYWLSDSPS